jgi:hypothetical protein
MEALTYRDRTVTFATAAPRLPKDFRAFALALSGEWATGISQLEEQGSKMCPAQLAAELARGFISGELPNSPLLFDRRTEKNFWVPKDCICVFHPRPPTDPIHVLGGLIVWKDLPGDKIGPFLLKITLKRTKTGVSRAPAVNCDMMTQTNYYKWVEFDRHQKAQWKMAEYLKFRDIEQQESSGCPPSEPDMMSAETQSKLEDHCNAAESVMKNYIEDSSGVLTTEDKETLNSFYNRGQIHYTNILKIVG